MDGDDCVAQAAGTALERMQAHAELVGIENTDESTFRSFFMAALRECHGTGRCQTEWHRYDLLVQLSGQNIIVEFKYYVVRRTHDLSGRPGKTKGGAGVQNKAEFWQCIEKLRGCRHDPIHARYMVLVYAIQQLPYHAHTFHRNYGELASNDHLEAVTTLERPPLVAKVIRVRGTAG